MECEIDKLVFVCELRIFNERNTEQTDKQQSDYLSLSSWIVRLLERPYFIPSPFHFPCVTLVTQQYNQLCWLQIYGKTTNKNAYKKYKRTFYRRRQAEYGIAFAILASSTGCELRQEAAVLYGIRIYYILYTVPSVSVVFLRCTMRTRGMPFPQMQTQTIFDVVCKFFFLFLFSFSSNRKLCIGSNGSGHSSSSTSAKGATPTHKYVAGEKRTTISDIIF